MKYLYFILLLIAIHGNAQDVKSTNLTWSITQMLDLTTNASQTYQCVFKTNGVKNISWEQNKGYIVSFKVDEIIGAWPDVKTLGKLVYKISVEGDAGTLTFERTQSGLFITLDLSQGTTDSLRHKYTVLEVS